MDFIVNYYFDFKNIVFRTATSTSILDGFWLTIKLSLLAGALSLTWG